MEETKLLDLVMPYWINTGAPFYTCVGPGFVRIEAATYEHYGETVFRLNLTEIKYTERWTPDELINPFERLDPGLATRYFSMNLSDHRRSDKYGWLYWLTLDLQILFGRTKGYDKFTKTFKENQSLACELTAGCSQAGIRFAHPTRRQVQTIFDRIDRSYFDARYPSGDWALRFYVKRDLKVVACSEEIERGPFDFMCGLLYRSKEDILRRRRIKKKT